MNCLGKALALTAFFLGGGWLAWHFAYPSYMHRYRLTVEIEADGVVDSGSSVVEVTWYAQPAGLAGGVPFVAHMRGQATLVDLGRHGVVLTALTHPAAPAYLALRAFGLISPTHSRLEALARMKGPVESRPDNIPKLIWLSDRNDPDTARPVSSEDLSSTIGPSVRLVGARLELTRDAVTTDLWDALPWLRQRYQEEGEAIVRWSGDTRFRLYPAEIISGLRP